MSNVNSQYWWVFQYMLINAYCWIILNVQRVLYSCNWARTTWNHKESLHEIRPWWNVYFKTEVIKSKEHLERDLYPLSLTQAPPVPCCSARMSNVRRNACVIACYLMIHKSNVISLLRQYSHKCNYAARPIVKCLHRPCCAWFCVQNQCGW